MPTAAAMSSMLVSRNPFLWNSSRDSCNSISYLPPAPEPLGTNGFDSGASNGAGRVAASTAAARPASSTRTSPTGSEFR